MGWKLLISIAAAFAVALAADCPIFCVMQYQPACGSNGKFYTSECELETESCQCDYCFDKVSSCESLCSGSTAPQVQCSVMSESSCRLTTCTAFLGGSGSVDTGDDTTVPVDGCTRICTKEYKPVCGSDGRTYGNTCVFEEANCVASGTLTITASGECPKVTSPLPIPTTCDRTCNMVYQPVCANDTMTYVNECILQIAICLAGGKLVKVSEGDCPATTTQPRSTSVDNCPPAICTMELNPVCGSDGKTYMNTCLLTAATTCTNGVIALSHSGACETTSDPDQTTPCPDTCTDLQSYVCGTDGKTYLNACKMLQYACAAKITLDVAKSGVCTTTVRPTTTTLPVAQTTTTTECPQSCPRIYSPVCGSDGVTYGNICALNYVSCKSTTPIRLVNQGSCVATTTTPTPTVRVIATATPTPRYVRCQTASYCTTMLGAVSSGWICYNPMMCRPITCSIDASWRLSSCGPRQCGVAQDGSSANVGLRLGYCRPRV